MSRTPAPAFADDAVVVCIMGFAMTSPHLVVGTGTRLRGDHPAVKLQPHLFLPDGADDLERRAAWNALIPATNPSDPGPRTPVTLAKVIPDEQLSLCVLGCGAFGVDGGGNPRGARFGQKVRTSSALVRENSANFVSVTRGIDRSRAMVYQSEQPMEGKTFTADEDAPPVIDRLYRGQWVDVSDKRVTDYPWAFSRPDPLQEPDP